MKHNNITIILFILLLSAACTSTKITSSWHEPNKKISINNLHKVLVVAMFKTVAISRTAEDQMVTYLKGKGVVSYNYLNENFDKKNEEAIRNRIKADSFDGAITMRLIDVKKDRVYIPGRINTYPGYYKNFSSYYYRNWNNYATSGYFATTKIFTIEVNIYSIKEDKIIWTATTQTTNPDGVEKLTIDVANVVYKKMIREGFLSQ